VAIVDVPIFGGVTTQVSWLGLRVGGHLALSRHSSDESSELSLRNDFGHDDSTIHIVVVIIVIICFFVNLLMPSVL